MSEALPSLIAAKVNTEGAVAPWFAGLRGAGGPAFLYGGRGMLLASGKRVALGGAAIQQFWPVSILALTVVLSLGRPTLWRVPVHPGLAATIGALLTVALGLVPLDALLGTLHSLFYPVLTIVSLMIITQVAERAGLLRLLSYHVGVGARGDPRRLLALIFASGALTGTVFTNDAAVLIFTPLVVGLVEEVADESWTPASRVPFYFAVLNVANLVGALVISNPINIVVSSWFDIRFGEYAAWMMLPALIAMIVTYAALRVAFRGQLPRTCRLPRPIARADVDPALMRICVVVLALTLAGLFSETWTGWPTWAVAASGAAVLLACCVPCGHAPAKIVAGVAWDVIVFVVGIFIVVMGLRNAGLVQEITQALAMLGADVFARLFCVVGVVAAVSSSIMNNHPTADMMTWVIQDLHRSPLETKMLVFAALVGGDLGPKMLPIGSLAALMWFQVLASRGVHVSYRQYVAVGIPLAMGALAAALAVLLLELRLYQWWTG